MSTTALRLAATGDLHCSAGSRGKLQTLFARMAEAADALLLCGDLTDTGTAAEAQILVGELKAIGAPFVAAVLGNHDYHSDKVAELRKILLGGGIQVLDGDASEYRGVGFTGVKGFIGGFDGRMLQSWGEASLRAIVHEAMEESLKLESGLARLRTEHRVVLLHYSPIRSTVVGEPAEIFPFLGSSRLEEALHRHPVSVVFHGHAHEGAPEGRTENGIPVFNVAIPVMKRLNLERPFRVFEIPVAVPNAG
jgi:Icc-related predicted phosphoesterase